MPTRIIRPPASSLACTTDRTSRAQYTPVGHYGTFSCPLASAGNLAPSSTGGLSLAGKVPAVDNFSRGVQSTLGCKTVLDVAYVGAFGPHLLQERDEHTLPYI